MCLKEKIIKSSKLGKLSGKHSEESSKNTLVIFYLFKEAREINERKHKLNM